MTSLWFCTPVYKRFFLTKVCLEQRRRMIDALPFEANCVVVGDDENLELAESLGFHTVTMDNNYVGRKWNAGYRFANEHGATHIMPIGSDSFLHESLFAEETFVDGKGLAVVGLSSFAPDGSERVDLKVRYPAGFGVGMVYPAGALAAKHMHGEACDPKKNRGCDNSTWARVGRGRVSLRFLDHKLYRYVNFHSWEDSITDFRLVSKSSGRILERNQSNPLGVLYDLYPADLVDEIKVMYGLRGLTWMIQGPPPDQYNWRNRPKRNYPTIAKRQEPGRKDGMTGREYAQIAARRRREQIAINKARGLPLSRDEEMLLKFEAIQARQAVQGQR